MQSNYYQQAAEVARTEQTLAHTRELRERQRSELGQVRDMLAEVTGQLARDESLVEKLRSEIAELAPGAQAAASGRGRAHRRA